MRFSKKLYCFVYLLVLGIKSLIAQIDSVQKIHTITEPIIIEDQKSFSRDIQQTQIIHILDQRKIQQVTACNLSEGLNFQSGLRVETNCQTCNYTQLRMNGLQGNYTQVLINGIPIMGSFMSIYGLEQFSTRWVDKIEILKGAGSSLFGISTIGGTVNILTQMPKKSYADFQTVFQSINFSSSDYHISSNSAFVHDNNKIGVGLILNYRNRQF